MRSANSKTSNLRLLLCGLALGCMMVTLLASRSLLSTGEAVAHQIRQPRRGLQGSADPSTQPLSLGMPDAAEAGQVANCAHCAMHAGPEIPHTQRSKVCWRTPSLPIKTLGELIDQSQTSRYIEKLRMQMTAVVDGLDAPPAWSSVHSLHHSRLMRNDTSPKG